MEGHDVTGRSQLGVLHLFLLLHHEDALGKISLDVTFLDTLVAAGRPSFPEHLRICLGLPQPVPSATRVTISHIAGISGMTGGNHVSVWW